MLNLRRSSKKIVSQGPILDRVKSKKLDQSMIVEADWRTKILNESAVTNAYLRDLSNHCS